MLSAWCIDLFLGVIILSPPDLIIIFRGWTSSILLLQKVEVFSDEIIALFDNPSKFQENIHYIKTPVSSESSQFVGFISQRDKKSTNL